MKYRVLLIVLVCTMRPCYGVSILSPVAKEYYKHGAMSAYQKGDYQAAITQWSHALFASNPDVPDIQVLFGLGNAHYHIHDYVRAQEYFEKVLHRSDISSEQKEQALMHAAHCHVQTGDLPGALDLYIHVLELNPENESARKNKEIIERELQRKEEEQKRKEQQQKEQQQQEEKQPDNNDQQSSQSPSNESSRSDQQSNAGDDRSAKEGLDSQEGKQEGEQDGKEREGDTPNNQTSDKGRGKADKPIDNKEKQERTGGMEHHEQSPKNADATVSGHEGTHKDDKKQEDDQLSEQARDILAMIENADKQVNRALAGMRHQEESNEEYAW